MSRYPRLLAIFLVVIASVRIVSTYKILNHTTDEPAHLAAGMEWLEGGTYTYEDQHPPLARVLGAVGLHLAGSRWARNPNMFDEGFHLLGYAHRYTRNLYFSRLAMLPLFWVGATVVFIWTARIAGDGAAVLGTFMFSTTPPVLGHAGLATTDMAVTAFLGAAALSALFWVERPDWKRSLLFGGLSGLAALSKFSALVFLPAVFALMLAWHLTKDRPPRKSLLRKALKLAPSAAMTVFVAALLIWAGYRFSFGYVPFFDRSLPAPAFFTGIRAVWEHNREGHLAYLLGSLSPTGFWYYYPVVITVKTPLATLILFVAAIWFTIRRRHALNIGTPLAFVIAIMLIGFFGHINIGVRHILPVYIGISICCGAAARRLFQMSRALPTAAAVCLLAWQGASGALQHPDYIAYTNELAGSRPERILADSDLDWNQDMKRLALRLNQLGAQEFTFKIGSAGYLAAGNDFPRIDLMPDGDSPQPGWNAVAITPWKLSGEPRWAEKAVPKERIGRSILLYYFPR